MTEEQLIANLVSHKAGYTIAIGGGLELTPLAEGLYSVTYPATASLDAAVKEKRFKEATLAAEFFLEKRHSLKLGDDYLEMD